ncbi:head-tail adaptor protein [Pseudomonas sp. B21-023]|uniref:head-tail adaptor protein n=1 Tax=Pseudomonas sp. B21-023 TaxID=2895477 RepID=UPI00215EE979|nr:head-tail adaptor protein [Pseudomonas sp. B21-023]UVM14817.1 head-tail adaptor protein [Pseudomonas sp. B21-023]
MREPEAGELRTRAVVRIRNDTPKGSASLESNFEPVAKRWCKIEPLGTATYTGSVQTGTTITHRIYCRFVRDLDTRHELVADGRVFRVKRATGMRGRQVWSVIEVEELQAVNAAAGGGRGQLRFN